VPRPADPAVRVALIEAAAEIVASEGRGGLTLRRLASAVGTSTMAIYTHFGSMEELRRAVRREGFARLRLRLDVVRSSRDPVADLIVLGAAYYLSATSAPNLYRAMFLDGPVDAEDQGTGLDTFVYLVKGVSRCLDAGRLPVAASSVAAGSDPAGYAVEIWALEHGLVTLQLAHLLPPDEAVQHLDAGGRALLLAWGDEPAALARSRHRASRRITSTAAE
jgi:AcrR family transcriptional regulator